MRLHEQVATVLERYAGLEPVTMSERTQPDRLYLATPDRTAYALGWVVANQIIQARHATTAIDVMPVFHPQRGWDRFVITRRTSGQAFERVPADEFGRLSLVGPDAPRLVLPGRAGIIPLRAALESDADAAIAHLLSWIPDGPLPGGGAERLRENERAPRYPALFAAVADLIVRHPGVVARREVYIDDEMIGGEFHPLHLHAAELSSSGPMDRYGANLPVLTYNWFQLQYGELFAFFDRRGMRAVYRTDRRTWARPRNQLVEEPDERLAQRIAGWLRLDGRTPEEGVD